MTPLRRTCTGPYLGLFPLHDSNTRVGGSQVNADDRPLDGFRPETDTPEDDGRL